MLQNMAEGLNLKVIGPRVATLVAAFISSVLFGLAHAENLNATTLSTINTMLFAVLLLAAGYVLTGELALPIGFHVARNFVQVGSLAIMVAPHNLARHFSPSRSTGRHCGPANPMGTRAGCLGQVLSFWASC